MKRSAGLALALLSLSISPEVHAANLSYDLEGSYVSTDFTTSGTFKASITIDTASPTRGESYSAPFTYEFPIVAGSFTVGPSTYTADLTKSSYGQFQTVGEQSFAFDLIDDAGDSLDQVFTLFYPQTEYPLMLSHIIPITSTFNFPLVENAGMLTEYASSPSASCGVFHCYTVATLYPVPAAGGLAAAPLLTFPLALAMRSFWRRGRGQPET